MKIFEELNNEFPRYLNYSWPERKCFFEYFHNVDVTRTKNRIHLSGGKVGQIRMYNKNTFNV